MRKSLRSFVVGLALALGLAALPTGLLACATRSGDTTGENSFAGMFSTCDAAAAKIISIKTPSYGHHAGRQPLGTASVPQII